MGRKIRDPRLIPMHRAEIAKLYLQGLPMHEIATEMALPRSIIHDDLEAIRQIWLKSALQDFDAKRAEEVARIDRVEMEAWEQYERSKEDLIVQRQGAGAQGTWAETETTQRTGAAKYLDIVLRCIDRRIKIFGLDAPERSMSVHLEMIKVYDGIDLEAV